VDNQHGLAMQTRAHGAMLLYAFLVSTSFPIGKAITDQIDPVLLTFLRFSLASLFFWLFLSRREKIILPGCKDALRYAVISLTMVLFFVLMFEALKLTTPVKTGAIFTLLPLTSGLIGFVLMRIGMSPAQIVALVLGSMGAIWVLFDGSLDKLIAFDVGRGEFLFALGTLSFSAYAPLIKKLHRGENVLVMTFWVLVFGALLLAPFGLPKLVAENWLVMDGRVYLGLLYLALFNTAGTFFLAKFASVRLPPAKVMAYTYLTPGFVVVFAAFGNQLPSLSVVAGIGVTIMAMVLLHRTA